jgi:hypothetical protein
LLCVAAVSLSTHEVVETPLPADLGRAAPPPSSALDIEYPQRLAIGLRERRINEASKIPLRQVVIFPILAILADHLIPSPLHEAYYTDQCGENHPDDKRNTDQPSTLRTTISADAHDELKEPTPHGYQ